MAAKADESKKQTTARTRNGKGERQIPFVDDNQRDGVTAK
jgi:hypothetical protein